jgi:hypothetical protein
MISGIIDGALKSWTKETDWTSDYVVLEEW